MAPEQDWCLECGAAVTTRLVRPPSWRVPVAVALAVLGLLALVVMLTVGALSDDADEAASGGAPRAATTTPARPTPARPGTRTGTTPRAGAPATTPTETVPGASEATGGGAVPVWPRGREAYTVVAETTTDRAGAERRARELLDAGHDAGILRTNGYDFFSDGYWVVWAGTYPERPAAERAQSRVADDAPGAYVTLIRRRGGG